MKYSEKINWLEKHASGCEMAAEEMAIKLINQERVFSAISIFQSRCDFNLAWAYQLYPEVFIHVESIEFLAKHVKKFESKITIVQISQYDHLITNNEVNTLDDLRKLLK
jgi:adenine C2-methylase RlmN of 23S rRNA A2503 and tRNA A37